MKVLKYIIIVLTVLILLTSYKFSNQTRTQSLKSSDWVLKTLRIVSQEDINNKTSSYSHYSVILREVGHIVIFELITLPIYLMFTIFTRRNVLSIILTFIVVMLYAVFDEYHQEAVNGRGYEWLDIVLDFIGCSLSLTIAFVVSKVNKFLMKAK